VLPSNIQKELVSDNLFQYLDMLDDTYEREIKLNLPTLDYSKRKNMEIKKQMLEIFHFILLHKCDPKYFNMSMEIRKLGLTLI
jgi:hypothetical protein